MNKQAEESRYFTANIRCSRCLDLLDQKTFMKNEANPEKALTVKAWMTKLREKNMPKYRPRAISHHTNYTVR